MNDRKPVNTIESAEDEKLLFAGIYRIALTHKKLGITKEILATRIIPFLFPLSIENGLNLTQVGVWLTMTSNHGGDLKGSIILILWN